MTAAGSRRRPGRAERRIADGLRRGDPEALREVHAVHGAAVVAVLRRLLGDAATVEDVFQQVMVEVWQRGAQYDARRGALGGWVLTIARSRAIDQLRRRIPEPAGDALEGMLDRRAAPGHADRVAERRRVIDLLADLPDEERMPLVLRFYAGLSQPEVAEALGVPVGTIKTRMVRGLERLRGAIEAAEPRAEVAP